MLVRSLKLIFCIFTLVLLICSFPIVSGAVEYKEVKAEDIIKQIENGEDVVYSNSLIKGSLDLSEANLKTVSSSKNDLKVIESRIKIENSIFEDDVDFSHVIFQKMVSFADSSFSKEANFEYTTYKEEAIFDNVDFENSPNFRSVNFYKNASFYDAQFVDVSFFNTTFRSFVSLHRAHFDKFAIFSNCYFGSDADFGFATFNCPSNFDFAFFNGSADFICVKFVDPVSFVSANFSGLANFNNADFDEINFSIKYVNKISLSGSDYKELNVNWTYLKNSLVYDGPAYVKLIRNFRNLAQLDYADDALYHYHVERRKNEEMDPSTKFFDVFMQYTCEYGTSPELTIIWWIRIVVIFALFYFFWNAISKPIDYLDGHQKVSFTDALFFSMSASLTMSYKEWYPKERYRSVPLIEGFLGWLLLTIFVVTLTNVTIRP